MAECLGYGEYRAVIVSRETCLSPAHVIGDELHPVSLSWERTLNKTSGATVNFDVGDGQCCSVLQLIDPIRHELEILRNGETVWVGPILSVVFNPSDASATVTAQDLSWWLGVRIIHDELVWSGTDLATIFFDLVSYAISVDDPGIVVVPSPTGIIGDRAVGATDMRTVIGEIDELSRTGVDWTVAGRQFFVGGLTTTATRLATPLTEQEFTRLPTVRLSGENMANKTYVYGSGVVGEAGGPDPSDCVLVERAMSEPSILDAGSATAAAESWLERVREPSYILEGDSDLDYMAPIGIQELIPGQLITVDLGGCLPYSGVLRLQTVRVNVNYDGEVITIGAQPTGVTDVE